MAAFSLAAPYISLMTSGTLLEVEFGSSLCNKTSGPILRLDALHEFGLSLYDLSLNESLNREARFTYRGYCEVKGWERAGK